MGQNQAFTDSIENIFYYTGIIRTITLGALTGIEVQFQSTPPTQAILYPSGSAQRNETLLLSKQLQLDSA